MEVIATQTSLEELSEIPEILYKYRTWTDEFHKEIISKQIVFLSAPTSFEDPLDCKLQKRFDLITDKEVYDKYFNDSKVQNPHWSRRQHRKYARDWTKRSPIRDKQHIKRMQEEHFQKFNERFGVLSLTANSKRPEMWNKYADAHSGFCVGFDSRTMFHQLGGGGNVEYYEELPNIMPSDNFETEHFKQVFSKESKWKFEEEYRTHKFYQSRATISDRRIKLTKDCYKEIIFGAKLPEEARLEIIEVCKCEGLKVEFYEETIGHNGEILITKLHI